MPALLLSIPVLDTTTVMLARWRSGRAPGRPRPPLSPPCALGWSPTDAVLTLVGCQALRGGVAALVGRGAIATWIGVPFGARIAATLLQGQTSTSNRLVPIPSQRGGM